MYQFRFAGEESVISDIFKEPEISKTFEMAFMNNYGLLLNRIREYRAFLSSKYNPNADPSSFSVKLSEDELISNFKDDLKRYILHEAIYDVFSSKLNVKENILEILQGSFIEKSIMGAKLLYTFKDAIVDDEDDDVGASYDYLESLESEFLQK